MWRWQVKKFKELIKKNPVFVTALGLSGAVHVLGLLSFIIGYNSSNELRVTVMNTEPASVVLMPLVKRVSSPKPIAKALPQKKQNKPTSVVSAKKQTVKTIAKLTPKVVNTTQDATQNSKPKAPAVVAKKPESKLVKPHKDVKKPEVKPVEIAKKMQKSAVPAQKIEPKQSNDQVEQQPIAVGYQEYAELQMQEYFRQQIISNWSPPPGFGNDVVCEMKITISDQGVIERIDVSKSSGSRAYDTSVKRALQAITVPKWAHNKSVHVCFKQS